MKRITKSLSLMMIAAFVWAIPTLAQPAQAQSQSGGPSEADIQQSLFFENYRNNEFSVALPYMEWLLENAPLHRGETNWKRFIDLHEKLAEATDDAEQKRAHLESAIVLFDRIVPTFKDAGEDIDEYTWTMERGRFIQTHAEVLPDLQSRFVDDYLTIFEMDPERTDPYYVRVVLQMYLAQDDRDKALELMDRAEAVYSDNAEVIEAFNETRNSLFRSPEERITFIEGRLEQDPQNMDYISELFRLYQRVGDREKVRSMGRTMANMEPSARIYHMLGRMEHEDGRNTEAMQYYQQVVETATAEESELKRDTYYNMAIIHQEQGRLSNARNFAREALKLDPNFGNAYILIGDLYVTAVQQAGSFDRQDKAVYWLAIDMYERARSVDSSVASRAGQAINTYRRYFPDSEDLFFMNWEAGQQYRINYGPYQWINETTTVRRP